MADLNQRGIGRISQNLGFDMNTVASTTLYIVATGEEFTPFAVCISKISATLTTAVVTFGQSSAKTDFLPSQNLTNITTAGAAIWLMPVPSATPAREQVTYTAGEAFVIDVTTGDNATADVTVFGFLNDA